MISKMLGLALHAGRRAPAGWLRHCMRPSILASTLFIVAGCSSVGPRAVPRDRYEYSASIAESWKRQTLLNILKLRYLEPPTFVDVGQIVAGYSLETGLSVGATFPENIALGGNTATLGGSARFTDRPTITYTPLTGARFVKSLMTPLPPDSVFFMIQSGLPADAVLVAAAAAMNGLKNQASSITGTTSADARFLRALELLRKIQDSNAVGLRVRQDAQKQQTTLITFRSQDISEQTLADIRELRQLLQLDAEASELKLTFGATASGNGELAMLTRSVLQIMNIMASEVEVPEDDLVQGRATPGFGTGRGDAEAARLVRIHSGPGKPADAYVAVRWRDHWFWIDDRDLKTKRAFAFMMMLFTLSETGEKEPLPLITIPAQ